MEADSLYFAARSSAGICTALGNKLTTSPRIRQCKAALEPDSVPHPQTRLCLAGYLPAVARPEWLTAAKCGTAIARDASATWWLRDLHV